MPVRFWGYRCSPDGRPKDFVFLANWRGSASCRIFDASTGRLCSVNTARNTTYDRAYNLIFGECTQFFGVPPGARAKIWKPAYRALNWHFFRKTRAWK